MRSFVSQWRKSKSTGIYRKVSHEARACNLQETKNVVQPPIRESSRSTFPHQLLSTGFGDFQSFGASSSSWEGKQKQQENLLMRMRILSHFPDLSFPTSRRNKPIWSPLQLLYCVQSQAWIHIILVVEQTKERGESVTVKQLEVLVEFFALYSAPFFLFSSLIFLLTICLSRLLCLCIYRDYT